LRRIEIAPRGVISGNGGPGSAVDLPKWKLGLHRSRLRWVSVNLIRPATALVHGMTLATRNVRDFEGTGVVVVDPWQG
jgi:hypothetical protein